MFHHIMVPVDLSIKETLTSTLRVAADQARLYGIGITLVSVTGGLQAKVSHSTEKYRRLLREFADGVARDHGVAVDIKLYDVPDPSVEVDRVLIGALEDTGADLAVIGSHQPGWAEYIVNSHAGRLATHAPVSVFVVRTAP